MFKKPAPTSATDPAATPRPTWKVLIVDDEPEVHTITRLTLRDGEFLGHRLELMSAYSGREACELMQQHPDVALVFLDVVMETDNAGLQVVDHVRNQLGNQLVRIVLRTGQPGQAPERNVIVQYDINDYKEKTALDADKLYTTTYTALKQYKALLDLNTAKQQVERYRDGLEQVIKASMNLFEIRSLRQFANGLLHQIASLFHVDAESLVLRSNGLSLSRSGDTLELMAAIGRLGSLSAGADFRLEQLPPHVLTRVERALNERRTLLDGDAFVGYFPSQNGTANLIYLDNLNHSEEIDLRLIELFSRNISIAFDNLYLDQEIYDTQTEIIDTLGDVVETRSKESANHVRRVAHIARLLGQHSGLDETECQILFSAAPMHDVGKVAIPDSVLLKNGPLDKHEWEVMKRHAMIGSEVFGRSKRPMLQAASIIAAQHHEKFDGSGYPHGLLGHNIHIYGRIVAVADVFDALVNRRCYKEAWPLEKVLELLISEKGRHFDPALVDILLDHLDEVREIMGVYADAKALPTEERMAA
ncbi:MAG: DUF3369 domain-containing protein [Thiobacillus sp.]|uniref:DUF3369 domain-containing protein n=1 Tax=Thiobacillus sp. TaxID=924 RepID=UPI00273553AA|nr:DUF3369 domain-containing protein [Thiobacillus sp.]MDP3584209.1 DUF3369 domain-containing protein [Thiobacillus sp.]